MIGIQGLSLYIENEQTHPKKKSASIYKGAISQLGDEL